MVEKVENLGEQTTNSAKIFAFGAALFEKYPRIGKKGTFFSFMEESCVEKCV